MPVAITCDLAMTQPQLLQAACNHVPGHHGLKPAHGVLPALSHKTDHGTCVSTSPEIWLWLSLSCCRKGAAPVTEGRLEEMELRLVSTMTRLCASPSWLGSGPDMRLPEMLNSSSVLPKAGMVPCREPPAACTLGQ